MKTLTEFQAGHLKNALQLKKDLVQSGKTPEELPQAMGESLKLEGDKLTFLLSALEALGTKTEDLKRIVVFTLGETEKVPPGAQKIGEHFYSVEFYPPLVKNKDRRNVTDDAPRGKGRKRRGGRSSKDGKRFDRRPRENPSEGPVPNSKRVKKSEPAAG